MYAIQEINTGKFLYGTNFTKSPKVQRTSFDRMLTYETLEDARLEMLLRECNSDFAIVGIDVIVKQIYKTSRS